jgi:hypothetical protein
MIVSKILSLPRNLKRLFVLSMDLLVVPFALWCSFSLRLGVFFTPGRIKFDSDKPDGAPRKLLQSDRLSGLGWAPRISLLEGLKSTYLSFLSEYVQPETTGVNL